MKKVLGMLVLLAIAQGALAHAETAAVAQSPTAVASEKSAVTAKPPQAEDKLKPSFLDKLFGGNTKKEAAPAAVKEDVKQDVKSETKTEIKVEEPVLPPPDRAVEQVHEKPTEKHTDKTTEKAEEKPAAPAITDTCGGANNYLGLRVLSKGETLAPGSRKVDLSKLPVGTRVFDGGAARPDTSTAKDQNLKRLNLIIDKRNVIAEAFCG